MSTFPIGRPPCFGDTSIHDPTHDTCKACAHRSSCAEAVNARRRLDGIRGGVGYPSYTSAPAQAPSPVVATGGVAPPGVLASPSYTPPYGARPPTAQAPTVPSSSGLTVTSANSSVVYEKGGNPVREVVQRTVLSGVAAIFEELGRFARNDGYRFSFFNPPPKVTRCATCNHISPSEAQFCSGCGRSFRPPA